MENKYIESYIQLRQSMSADDWNTLDSLYKYQIHEKEHQLTKNLSLDESEISVFCSRAQELIGTSE